MNWSRMPVGVIDYGPSCWWTSDQGRCKNPTGCLVHVGSIETAPMITVESQVGGGTTTLSNGYSSMVFLYQDRPHLKLARGDQGTSLSVSAISGRSEGCGTLQCMLCVGKKFTKCHCWQPVRVRPWFDDHSDHAVEVRQEYLAEYNVEQGPLALVGHCSALLIVLHNDHMVAFQLPRSVRHNH